MIDVTDENVVNIAKQKRMRSPFPPEIENGVLPFPVNDVARGEHVLIAGPQVIFRPIALMMWGWDLNTVITGIQKGQRIEGWVNIGEVPASFFGTARTYEKLLEDFDTNGINPPSWISFSAARPGEHFYIMVRGRLRHAVMLGHVVY